MLNKDDPIMLNSKDRYESPLRKEKRPLMGIYHAAFILARVSYVLNKALSLKTIPEEEISYCQDLLTYYKKCYDESLNTVKTHAKMTPLGEALILSAGKLIH